MMTREKFAGFLDVYGADFSRWPPDSLKEALAMAEKDAEMRALFECALEEERVLRLHTVPLVDLQGLERRILAVVSALPPRQGAPADKKAFFQWRPALIFAPSGGLLAMAALGFFMGMQPALQAETLVNPVYYQAEQILADDSGLYEGGFF
jgi:hypothetical protein